MRVQPIFATLNFSYFENSFHEIFSGNFSNQYRHISVCMFRMANDYIEYRTQNASLTLEVTTMSATITFARYPHILKSCFLKMIRVCESAHALQWHCISNSFQAWFKQEDDPLLKDIMFKIAYFKVQHHFSKSDKIGEKTIP